MIDSYLDEPIKEIVWLLPFIAFWVWMLIDVKKRPIAKRQTWGRIVLYFGPLGALLYFLGPRRGNATLLSRYTSYIVVLLLLWALFSALISLYSVTQRNIFEKENIPQNWQEAVLQRAGM